MLEMVFSRLSSHNLKLAPKKCFFLRRSDKFLGNIVCEEGIRTDPGKVEAISKVQKVELMEADGQTPCSKKIRSFLGMVLYYQHFIEGCSAKAKPLFKLTAGSSRKQTRGRKGRKSKTGSPTEALKTGLLHTVTLAHPFLDQPFILAVDATFDGVRAVLYSVSPDEQIARPVAFASTMLSHSQMN